MDYDFQCIALKIQKQDYPSTMKVPEVSQNGAMRWKSYFWSFLTDRPKGKYVGTEDKGNGIWRVFYRDIFLGYFVDKKRQTSIN
ncbi:hypothetical protein [Psychroflexus sp. MES1-P1E]|uniref:hypothetical protein n=1 Tax=Psychroflexus sp. MES1-P1E TaxID=2058320 RepID=UPI000C7D87A3|nr:hypothetical protein [Psychroflexus sp. MES1-P1E]PKG43613.1 hypothetical protein CXF67_04145 [Psychroflexus sp. MES1-P1E]